MPRRNPLIDAKLSLFEEILSVAEYMGEPYPEDTLPDWFRIHWKRFLDMQTYTPAIKWIVRCVCVGWILALIAFAMLFVAAHTDLATDAWRYIMVALLLPVLVSYAVWGGIAWYLSEKRHKRLMRYFDRRERRREAAQVAM